MPGWSWVKWLCDLSLRVTQGLKMPTTKGLGSKNVYMFYIVLENIYASENMMLIAFERMMKVELK